MAFNRFLEQRLGKLTYFFIFAILEWVIIILLFVDGFVSFLANEFAEFFELRIPCFLCTRIIDRILLHRNPNFYYNDSICESHKKEISSLAYCHVHRKLSDIKSMCEGCLLSFATERESVDSDLDRSLVGILHKDIDCSVGDIVSRSAKKDDVGRIQKSGAAGGGGGRLCSCCGEGLKAKPSSTKSYGRSSSMAQGPAPSPRTPITWRCDEPRNLGMSQFRYTELKFISDNDVPEDEDALNKENQYSEDMTEDGLKTPTFIRGNKFFGIPLSDSAQASPRWSNRLHKKLQLEKLDLIRQSNDTNSSVEAESDPILHGLKRQVRLDRKSLFALYLELDEERSASAVAANNAMAMITRLQAEKAAVQMEALQYQRMMEEQAEYDQDAMQIMKELLVKREEEAKGLEAELEVYREKYGQIKRVGSEVCEVDDDEDYQELKSQSISEQSDGEDSPSGEDRSTSGGGLDESLNDFEGERSQMMGFLRNLERKISSSEEAFHSSEIDRGNENKGNLTREMSLLRERLRAIEADSGFLKHATMTLQKGGAGGGGEGTKLLKDIAQQLRKIRQLTAMPLED